MREQLARRVGRLEVIAAPPRPACGSCGADAGRVALLGLPAGAPLPGWVGPGGRCPGCGRLVRVYRGVDLALV